MIKYILWTGGWDSTYRMVELSRMKEVEVYPIYIKDHTRPSMHIEIDTLEKLWKRLTADSRTVARIKPIHYIEDALLPEDKNISEAWKKIHEKISIGSQYEYIARLASLYPGIELGIEKPNGEFSGCYATINRLGKLIKKDNTFMIDQEKSSEECNLLFGNVTFPIIDITEVEMIDNIKEWGYTEFMKGIHFCYTPRHGLPCGTCRPCQQKMECGMGMLLPKRAHIRYYIFTRRVSGNSILWRIIWKLANIVI
mgnify:CR=1 FL=1